MDGRSTLAAHLVRFHAGDELHRGRCFGWHLHFILPWASLEDGPCPANGRPQDFREVVIAPSYGASTFDRMMEAQFHDALAWTVDLSAMAAGGEAGDLAEPLPELRTSQFLQTFTVSFVGDLISVARC